MARRVKQEEEEQEHRQTMIHLSREGKAALHAAARKRGKSLAATAGEMLEEVLANEVPEEVRQYFADIL